jgi:hypothetical protein
LPWSAKAEPVLAARSTEVATKPLNIMSLRDVAIILPVSRVVSVAMKELLAREPVMRRGR